MRLTLVVCLLLAALPAPLLAQSAIEGRVGRLESEMRAVQRKVFPGGAGAYLEPQIAAPASPAGPGVPASDAIEDVTARVASLEGQIATLTGQIEQNQYRVRQLEERFEAYRKATDARLSAGAVAPMEPADRPVSPAAPSRPLPAATRDPERGARVAAVERPADTGDAAEAEYMYGYRLWAARFYPEAEAQLRKVVVDHPGHRRASYAQNLLGRSYLDEGKPSLASIAFYDSYKKMPDGERAPDSLYFLGQALIQLNKPADACKVYGELDDVYGARIDAALRANVDKARIAAKCK